MSSAARGVVWSLLVLAYARTGVSALVDDLIDDENQTCDWDEVFGSLCLWKVDGSAAGVVLEVVVFVLAVVGLLCVCNSYLVPPLETLCRRWEIREDVAGCTFLAFGSAAPEILINSLETLKGSDGDTQLGVSAVLGSGMIAFLIIPGLCGLTCGPLSPPMALNRRPLARDTIAYIAGLTELLVFLADGTVDWKESLFMVATYVVYVVVVIASPAMRRMYRVSARRKAVTKSEERSLFRLPAGVRKKGREPKKYVDLAPSDPGPASWAPGAAEDAGADVLFTTHRELAEDAAGSAEGGGRAGGPAVRAPLSAAPSSTRTDDALNFSCPPGAARHRNPLPGERQPPPLHSGEGDADVSLDTPFSTDTAAAKPDGCRWVTPGVERGVSDSGWTAVGGSARGSATTWPSADAASAEFWDVEGRRLVVFARGTPECAVDGVAVAAGDVETVRFLYLTDTCRIDFVDKRAAPGGFAGFSSPGESLAKPHVLVPNADEQTLADIARRLAARGFTLRQRWGEGARVAAYRAGRREFGAARILAVVPAAAAPQGSPGDGSSSARAPMPMTPFGAPIDEQYVVVFDDDRMRTRQLDFKDLRPLSQLKRSRPGNSAWWWTSDKEQQKPAAGGGVKKAGKPCGGYGTAGDPSPEDDDDEGGASDSSGDGWGGGASAVSTAHSHWTATNWNADRAAEWPKVVRPILWLGRGWEVVFRYTIPHWKESEEELLNLDVIVEDEPPEAQAYGPEGDMLLFRAIEEQHKRRADRANGWGSQIYPLTFAVALLWLAFFSIVVASVVLRWSDLSGLDSGFFAVLLIAVAAEIPDCAASVCVARRGCGPMACANAMGAQNINVFIGLGLPWLISGVVRGEVVVFDDPDILRLTTVFCFAAAFLFLSMTLLAALVQCRNKATLGYRKGKILIGFYFVVLTAYAVSVL
eukprot:gene17577-27062_t